jgi:hypothetical protein
MDPVLQGYTVAYFIEVLCYKPEGREFDFRLGYTGLFSIYLIPSAALWPWDLLNL